MAVGDSVNRDCATPLESSAKAGPARVGPFLNLPLPANSPWRLYSPVHSDSQSAELPEAAGRNSFTEEQNEKRPGVVPGAS